LEFQKLAEWLTELDQNRLRVAEPRTEYRADAGHPMTVEEYLEFESGSRIRHEYLAGEVFAMSGVHPRHNRIAGKLYQAFGNHLKGGPCEPYMGDVKVKLRANRDDYVYYPDVMVVCGRQQPEQPFVTNPKLIVEVLSRSTAGVDRHEKRVNYRWIAALEEYVIVAQSVTEVTLFRRDEAWRPTVLHARDSILELRSIDFRVPLAQIYEGELM
jgi:Uma2 family endonuclease